MPAAASHRVMLTCHADAPAAAVHGVEVGIRALPQGMLALDYALEADLARVRILPSETAGRADGLWQHTCFEAFIRSCDGRSYCELNFAANRDWAAYRFDGYRAAMRPLPMAAPQLSVCRREQRLELQVLVQLPEEFRSQGVRMALSAIVEEDDGRLSFWALRHPPGKPDFHHAGAFALEL
ncbi:MAG TPA: DOMON-like domain-containing protein [Steroidobacteraceae bacterium]